MCVELNITGKKGDALKEVCTYKKKRLKQTLTKGDIKFSCGYFHEL